MANSRSPHPTGYRDPADINDGTLQRSPSPLPGSIGLGVHVLTNPVVPIQLGLEVWCLMRVSDQMERQTWRYLREASRNGDYQTSPAGVRYITEDRVDAFGHCYMGCEGTKRCGLEPTCFLGESREVFRETMKIMTLGIWGHNSFEEDVFNQAFGRRIAQMNPGLDCYQMSYRAVVRGVLKLHGHNSSDHPDLTTRIYNCAEITLDDHEYSEGWHMMPWRYVTNLVY